jgi:MoaA/NifB/PqqE/SkfB family radical SAM enzyme
VDELAPADAATVGLGFEPARGPGHENLRVLNIRGTGACNSDCVWCVEKFDPAHRSMPKADSTRQFILDGAGRFDMLFFASGEPTIHPKLFEYVELGRSVGFTSFGMSSHFRTFADPRFTLRILQAGFQYFDISLHAADATAQLAVNPIDDGGASLFEALKGLGRALSARRGARHRISVTHKIVVSRLNVTELEAVFRATYERGVRHFILQPVRAMNLEPQRQAAVDITEDEILPHLNDFLRRTEGLGADRQAVRLLPPGLFDGDHIEHEQNRLKNVYGRDRGAESFDRRSPRPQPARTAATGSKCARSEHDRPLRGDGRPHPRPGAGARHGSPVRLPHGIVRHVLRPPARGPHRPEWPDLPHPGAGAAGLRPALSGASAVRRHPVDLHPGRARPALARRAQRSAPGGRRSVGALATGNGSVTAAFFNGRRRSGALQARS